MVDIILSARKHETDDGGRIAILGGIDVVFWARYSTEQIKLDAKKLLALTKDKGGSALSSGNSRL